MSSFSKGFLAGTAQGLSRTVDIWRKYKLMEEEKQQKEYEQKINYLRQMAPYLSEQEFEALTTQLKIPDDEKAILKPIVGVRKPIDPYSALESAPNDQRKDVALKLLMNKQIDTKTLPFLAEKYPELSSLVGQKQEGYNVWEVNPTLAKYFNLPKDVVLTPEKYLEYSARYKQLTKEPKPRTDEESRSIKKYKNLYDLYDKQIKQIEETYLNPKNPYEPLAEFNNLLVNMNNMDEEDKLDAAKKIAQLRINPVVDKYVKLLRKRKLAKQKYEELLGANDLEPTEPTPAKKGNEQDKEAEKFRQLQLQMLEKIKRLKEILTSGQ